MPSEASRSFGPAVTHPAEAAPASLTPARRYRVEMREAMTAVEKAIAAPVPGRADQWAAAAEHALARLAADFAGHVAVTEAPGGLHEEIVNQSPRLSGPVGRLAVEHGQISAAMQALRTRLAEPLTEEEAWAVREQVTDLLGRLARHRQRGADLVWEAFSVDIGGET